MTSLTLEDLIARAEITDVIHRYAAGLDRRDWALYRSVFTDEFDLDFSSWGVPPRRIRAEEWAAMACDTLSGFDSTQHTFSNHAVTRDGDEATCVTDMQARHFLVVEGKGEMQSLGGFYTNRLRRGTDGWKIHSCTLTVTWSLGDRRLFKLARERWESSGKAAGRPQTA